MRNRGFTCGTGGPRGELSSAHGWPRQSAEGDQLPIGSYRVRMGATRSRRVQPTTGARSHTTPLTMRLNPL